jgi:predicted HTH transcriptional regulator
LANCLIHADYSESGSIVIEKGPDYFKFSNPGNLRIPIEIAMQGGRSDPRNVILHQMFSYLGYGERAGSGLYMINKVWSEKEWIKPKMKVELNPNRTMLTLYMKKQQFVNNYPNNYPNELTQIQIKILEIIKANPRINVRQISEQIKEIKYDAVRWNIAELKKKKIIDRKGTTRKGVWSILVE